jgi:hypothetical protein
VAHYGTKKGACRFVVEKPEGKKQLFVPRIKWDNNKGYELKEIGWGVIDLNDLPQDEAILRAVVNTKLTFVFHEMR